MTASDEKWRERIVVAESKLDQWRERISAAEQRAQQAESERDALRDGLQEIESLTSGGICVVGERGKDRYIRRISDRVHALLRAAEGGERDA